MWKNCRIRTCGDITLGGVGRSFLLKEKKWQVAVIEGFNEQDHAFFCCRLLQFQHPLPLSAIMKRMALYFCSSLTLSFLCVTGRAGLFQLTGERGGEDPKMTTAKYCCSLPIEKQQFAVK
jgi:hypothetical protein